MKCPFCGFTESKVIDSRPAEGYTTIRRRRECLQCAKRFTDIPGASAAFLGGAVVYTNGAKTRILGLDPDMIKEKGAVSYEVAKALAENVRTLIGADIGIGVTGLAGPDGDGVHEVGTVFVSMAVDGKTYVRSLHMGTKRTRSFIRRMSGNHAFDMMRRWLSGLEVETVI